MTTDARDRGHLRDSSAWLDWPSGPIRVGVVFLVAVTIASAVFEYPGALRSQSDAASRNSELSFSDREIAGGNGLVVDQQAVYQARARIGPDETFHVVVGEGYRGGTELTAPFVADYYRYFLMPRRPAEDAQWIICYGCDLGQYGAAAHVVWRNGDGISLARIGR